MSERYPQPAGTGSSPSRPALWGATLIIVLLLGCGGPSSTFNVYVDPAAGSDANPGTSTQPYKTLTHALSVATAGHTIHLAAGNYDAVSGEVWPTHAGIPPTAEANVPDGVTITADGNMVRLVGPLGNDSQSALVFAGSAEVMGVAIVGFEVGVMAGDATEVVLEGVQVSGNGEIGVHVAGAADLTLLDSIVADNGATGLQAVDEAVVSITDSELFGNFPAIEASGSSSVTITGSDLHDNGSAAMGGTNSAVRVLDSARLSVEGSMFRDNAFAGIYMQDAANVTVGTGTDMDGNFVGVIVEDLPAGEARLEISGATIHDSVYQGVRWLTPMGASFKMRNTAVTNSGDSGVYFGGDAATIDLGTTGDPGGNDYSGNVAPFIVDNRPARAAPDGTVATISQEDIAPGCAVMAGVLVGPDTLVCDGVTVLSISKVNNRFEVVQAE